jgi:hypothetical protein
MLFKHVGYVWEACNNMLKKTPYTNRAIVGQNLAQVAISFKDLLQKMK